MDDFRQAGQDASANFLGRGGGIDDASLLLQGSQLVELGVPLPVADDRIVIEVVGQLLFLHDGQQFLHAIDLVLHSVVSSYVF